VTTLLGEETARKFLQHENVERLSGPPFLGLPRRPPSYISEAVFVATVLDLCVNPDGGDVRCRRAR